MDTLSTRDQLAVFGRLGLWVAVIASPVLVACAVVLAIAALAAGPSTGGSTAPRISHAASPHLPVAAAGRR